MSADAFLDTNILLYAVSTSKSEHEKRLRARDLLTSDSIGFSTQVFAEFYVNATQKLSPRLSHDEAVAILPPLQSLPVQSITNTVVFSAFSIRKRYEISYWDAAIVAAALELECETIWSEDLNDGQSYDNVIV